MPAVELLARTGDGGGVADWSTEQLALGSRRLAAHALDAAAELPSFGGAIHVNVTAIDLEHPTFADDVLQRFPLRADHLVLELTEHFELRASRSVTTNLRRLREAGVRFALDDFGDGWSTMATLRALRPEVLKVDLRAMRSRHGIDRATAGWVRERAERVRCEEIVVERLDTVDAVEEVLDAGFVLGQGFVLDRFLARRPDGAPVEVDLRVA